MSCDRQIALGFAGYYIGPIPTATMARFAERYGTEERAFRNCIGAMDDVFRQINSAPSDKDADVVMDEPFSPTTMSNIAG